MKWGWSSTPILLTGCTRCVCACMRMYVCVHVRVRVCARVHVHVCVHICVSGLCVRVRSPGSSNMRITQTP